MRSRLPAIFHPDDLATAYAAWLAETGERVRQRRTLLVVTRRDLAHLCGTNESTITRVERGEQAPRDRLRMAIAAVLRCEVADLWPYPPVETIRSLAQAAA